LFSAFSFDAFCISTIMRCAHDLRTFRTFYTFQWLTNRIRWCDVSWRIFRIRRQFDSVFLCVRIFDNWSIVVKCDFYKIVRISWFRRSSWDSRKTFD
jgi:hypothetical protein